MADASFTVDCPAFARGLHNALVFAPASSRFAKYVSLTIDPDVPRIRLTGTDTYTGGTEFVSVDGYSGHPFYMHGLMEIGKAGRKDDPGSGAAELERFARMAGQVPGRVIIENDTLTLDPMGEESFTLPLNFDPKVIELYETLFGFFDDAEKRDQVIPGTVLVDPGFFARLSKVKVDKKERKADLMFGPEDCDPILIKIGPTFQGLIMPVHRETHGDNIGQDGLW